MKKIITLFTFLLAASFGVYSQTNNLNYNYLKVYFHQGVGVVDNETQAESRYHIKAAGTWGTGTTPQNLLNTTVGADNIANGATFYKYDHNSGDADSYFGPWVYYPILPTDINSVNLNTEGKFDVSVMSYAYDVAPETKHMNGTSGNMGYLNTRFDFVDTSFPNNQIFEKRNIDNGDNGTNNDIGSYTGYGSDSYYYINYCYRPYYGRKDRPLDFGTLVCGAAAISHKNSNRSSPNSTYFNSWAFGYANDWDGNGFYPGNDITYQFTITKQQTVKWTISKTTSDSQKFLVSRLMDANNVAIYGSFQSSANQDHSKVLSAGTYTLVLDGYGYSETSASSFHDFDISISATDYSSNPGSIANSTNDFLLCPNEVIPAINNASSASGTVGTPPYQWRKQLVVNGVAQGWVQYTAAGTGASATNLGTMENADICWIMRGATICGGVVWSNQMEFTRHNVTLNAGTITGSKTVPFPHEQGNGSIGNVSSASASPSQVILWQKSTNPDSESSWGNADGVNSSQSYTLPASILQTTSFRRKISNACDGVAGYNGVTYSNVEVINVLIANGHIQGKVYDRNGIAGGNGIDNIDVVLARVNSIPGGKPNYSKTVTTSNGGNFSFNEVYYGDPTLGSTDASSFTITPVRDGHTFVKPSETLTLNRSNATTQPILAFSDTTGFAITGYITQECANCDGGLKIDTLKDVIILESQIAGGPAIDLGLKSGASGSYSTIKDLAGNYTIKPKFETHEFEPNQRVVTIDLETLISGQSFKDTTTHSISGNVFMDCPTYQEVGVASLTFTKILESGTSRISRTISTLQNGSYSARLPAGKYRVYVNSVIVTANSGLNNDLYAPEIVGFFNGLPDSMLVRDITNLDATLDLDYHEKPVIITAGLDGPTCLVNGIAKYSDRPIFEQLIPRTFDVSVYRGKPVKGCFVKDDTLSMSSNIQESNAQTKYLTSNGQVSITLIGGQPTLNEETGYKKDLAFGFSDIYNNPAEPLVLTPVVTGVVTSPSGIKTTSPQIPFVILRDPPGDGSFSFMEQNVTVETVHQSFVESSKDENKWDEIKLGSAFELGGLGISIPTEIWGSVGNDYTKTTRNLTDKQKVIGFTRSTEFKTSDTFTGGSGGDVFVGAAINHKYSIVQILSFNEDSCKFLVTEDFMMADSGFATEFVFSENYIKNSLIPLLQDQANLTSNDSIKWENGRQIKVWRETLQLNEDLKKRAIFKENRTFDGAAGPYTNYTVSDTSKFISIEYEVLIDSAIASEMGFSVYGNGGSKGKVTRFKRNIGGFKSRLNVSERRVGYTLDDDEPGDIFSVDIKIDPVYHTPVFDLAGGTSSCPNEEGSIPRDKFDFSVSNSILENQPNGIPIVFNLNLFNSSVVKTDTNKTYYVRYVNASAPGAKVSYEGNGLTQPFAVQLRNRAHIKPELGLSASADLTFGVEKSYPTVPQNHWGHVRIQAYDGCEGPNNADPGVIQELSLIAGYANSCSPITLSKPLEGFSINSASNILAIEFSEYLHGNMSASDKITFEWAKAGTEFWSQSNPYYKADLNTNGTTQKNIDISTFDDGDYRFRAVLRCGLETVYSRIVNGAIDRKAPELFGNPQPSDDVYTLGDVIGAKFTENIKCSSLTSDNFRLKKANGDIIGATIGCYNNEIIISPTSSILTLNGERLYASVNHISDVAGNVNSDTLKWDFFVGQAQTITSPYLVTISAPNTLIYEDSPDSLEIIFNLTQKIHHPVIINFNIAGTAEFISDYDTKFHKTNIGFTGSVRLDSAEVSKKLLIKPISDGQLEPDETVIVSISNGVEYQIGAANTATFTILNDDAAANDCDNNGNPFSLVNNNSGNSALVPGTYHKLLLESDGLVDSPITVVFKGERSITLKPGFEVENGSVFTAILEDCPEGIASFSIPESNGKSLKVGNINSESSKPEVLISEKYHLVEMDANGDIQLVFKNKFERSFSSLLLMEKNYMPVDNSEAISLGSSGNDEAIVHTNVLEKGNYILQIERDGDIVYHRFMIN
jgi:hypothetical protein